MDNDNQPTSSNDSGDSEQIEAQDHAQNQGLARIAIPEELQRRLPIPRAIRHIANVCPWQSDVNSDNCNGPRHNVEEIPIVTISLIKEIAISMADEIARKNPTADIVGSALEAEFAVDRLRAVFSDSGAPGLPWRRKVCLPFGLTLDRYIILPNAVETERLSPEVIELAKKNLGYQTQRETLLLHDVISGLNTAIAEGTLLAVEDGTILVGLRENLVVKVGLYSMLDDISMLRYIGENAQIPLPVTHGCLRAVDTQVEWGFLFMSNYYDNGCTLEELWGQLNHAEKWSIGAQLNGIFGALRSVELPRPFPAYREILGGGSPRRRCKDSRGFTYLATTPINNEREFNSFLIRHLRDIDERSLELRPHLQENHKMVMTYANLHPRNVIISPRLAPASTPSLPQHLEYEAARRDWRVTCLVNWQRGGVYPEHWEYVKALNPADTAGCPPLWWYYLPRSIGVWPREHAVDNLIVGA
ncbi:hypothetical protein EMPG_10857 [Blastomyces silverae]|uniref:Aminoglycoside phosphotransferase domain-containing protein n=1 Tax=Blastomyces silverae TaxID=2060906 RepID=A0A0H1B2M1_9EURO|nr:hypothetical protein EMPG_10857 [Blastomyces silverae]